jgi:hypothetical protein
MRIVRISCRQNDHYRTLSPRSGRPLYPWNAGIATTTGRVERSTAISAQLGAGRGRVSALPLRVVLDGGFRRPSSGVIDPDPRNRPFDRLRTGIRARPLATRACAPPMGSAVGLAGRGASESSPQPADARVWIPVADDRHSRGRPRGSLNDGARRPDSPSIDSDLRLKRDVRRLPVKVDRMRTIAVTCDHVESNPGRSEGM